MKFDICYIIFCRAAKMYNIPSKKRASKKSTKNKTDDLDLFATNFSQLIQKSPPPNPPGLFKYLGRRVDGKVSLLHPDS